VGKRDDEIKQAIDAGIAAFNLRGEEEIENVDRVAGSIGKTTVGALRVNPDVDPKTHNTPRPARRKRSSVLISNGPSAFSSDTVR